jgi:DNA-binding transcriptional LysR family regulator
VDISSDLELRHLRYFVAVAEELHFGRAAARVGIAQPPLSQQIQRLERILGCPLLTRRPRVALTEAGSTLLGAARRTLAQVESGLDDARRAGRGETGPLAIGFVGSAMLTSLPDIIRAYREWNPEVQVRLRELNPAEELEAPLDGSVDVAFVREHRADGLLVYEPAVREPFTTLLPPGHRLAWQEAVNAEELSSEPFVHFARDVAPTLYDQVLDLCRNAGYTPKVAQEVREWMTHISLVQAGLGVAIVPESVQKLKWGGVEYRPLAGPAGSFEAMIDLCYVPGEIKPTAARFLSVVRRHGNLASPAG